MNFNNNLVVVGSLEVSSIGLTASASGVTKVYDGTTSMTGVTLGLSTLKAGDVVTVNGQGAFSSRSVGTNLSYSISALSLSGADAGNYHLTGGSSFSGSNGQITPASAFVTGTTTNLTYNGQIQHEIAPTSSGFLAGDSITISGAASGKDAGTYQSNLTVSGTDVGNYSVTVTNADLVISPKAVTVTNTSRSSTYDGSSTYGSLASGMTFTTSALIGQDSVASVTQTATGVTTGAVAKAGNFSVIPSVAVMGTGLASNYSFSYAASTHSVNKASLQVSANNASKTYDAAAYSGGNGVSYTGLVGGESASVLGGTLSYGGSSQGATNVGSYTITPSGLSSNNYAITYANSTLTISPAALMAIVGALTGSVNKVYDGTNTATLDSTNFQLSGWMGSDGASVTKTTGTYDSKSVGTGKTVTVNLASSDYAPTGSTVLANYSLPTTITGAVGSVTPAALRISGITAVDKVYDGTTAAMINTTGTVKDGLITGDIVNIVASGAFDDKNVGNAKVVSITGMALNGPDAGNYRLASSSASVNANISKAVLLVIGAAANDKTFDGTNSATVTGGRVSPIGSDAVGLSAANATFNDASIGINKPVSTLYTLIGPDAVNYNVVQPDGLTASINANPVSVPAVQQLVVIPAATVSVVTPSVPLVTVSTSDSTTPAGPLTTATSGTTSQIAIAVTGSLTPVGSSTSSGGNSNQGTSSFVAVKTFDVVKVSPGTTFNLTLPENTFTHSVSTTPLQISATTATGSPLPDWVIFSPGERRFTGTPPLGVTSLQVMVVATDTNGNQVSTTLSLQFGG